MISISNQLKFWIPLLSLLVVATFSLCKIHDYRDAQRNRAFVGWDSSQTNKFFAMYSFNLSSKNRETTWNKKLSKELNGKTEVKVSAGRIDVLTDNLAIEVERVSKWHEGVGQALHYGLYSKRQPTLALIIHPPSNDSEKNRMDVIQNVCERYGINLIVLVPRQK